jgi:hypothetical protein
MALPEKNEILPDHLYLFVIGPGSGLFVVQSFSRSLDVVSSRER